MTLSSFLADEITGTYQPSLQGATEWPGSVNYSTRVGTYRRVGKMCFVRIRLVTTTMTKTTLTDSVRISLPFAAAADALLTCRVYNATPVQNANMATISSGTSYLIPIQVPLVAAPANLTYATTSLGVLSNTITFEISGWYEVA